jgi:hypothetical protein
MALSRKISLRWLHCTVCSDFDEWKEWGDLLEACKKAQDVWTFGFTQNFELRFGQGIIMPSSLPFFFPLLMRPNFSTFVVLPFIVPLISFLDAPPLSFQVISLLMDCIEPVEAAFVNRFAQLEEQDPSNFLKLQEIAPFNSSVGAPLSQRSLVESGGALVWWMSLVKEVDDFTETMKINRKHKGRQASARCHAPHGSNLNIFLHEKRRFQNDGGSGKEVEIEVRGCVSTRG